MIVAPFARVAEGEAGSDEASRVGELALAARNFPGCGAGDKSWRNARGHVPFAQGCEAEQMLVGVAEADGAAFLEGIGAGRAQIGFEVGEVAGLGREFRVEPRPVKRADRTLCARPSVRRRRHGRARVRAA